jgi:hypothetical protein
MLAVQLWVDMIRAWSEREERASLKRLLFSHIAATPTGNSWHVSDRSSSYLQQHRLIPRHVKGFNPPAEDTKRSRPLVSAAFRSLDSATLIDTGSSYRFWVDNEGVYKTSSSIPPLISGHNGFS